MSALQSQCACSLCRLGLRLLVDTNDMYLWSSTVSHRSAISDCAVVLLISIQLAQDCLQKMQSQLSWRQMLLPVKNIHSCYVHILNLFLIKEAYLRTIITIAYNRKAWVVRDLKDPLVPPQPLFWAGMSPTIRLPRISSNLILNTSSDVGKS